MRVYRLSYKLENPFSAIRIVLIMPEYMSAERRAAMQAYGAEIILISKQAGIKGARDLALQQRNANRQEKRHVC
jgi:cysteine synthase